jgi:hypothetical protein
VIAEIAVIRKNRNSPLINTDDTDQQEIEGTLVIRRSESQKLETRRNRGSGGVGKDRVIVRDRKAGPITACFPEKS